VHGISLGVLDKTCEFRRRARKWTGRRFVAKRHPPGTVAIAEMCANAARRCRHTVPRHTVQAMLDKTLFAMHVVLARS